MKKLFIFSLLSASFYLCWALNGQAQSKELYVSPDAAPGGNGTIESPFNSLFKARDHVRAIISDGLDKDVIIWLREGTYYLDKTFTLDWRDSGTKIHSITYSAYPMEKVVIHGGRRIKGDWKEQEDGSWMVYVPEVASGKWGFRQLFINGERRHLARRPNKGEGYFFLTGLIKPEDKDNPINRKAFRFKPGDIRSDWNNLQDVEVVKFIGSRETLLAISKVDADSSIVWFQKLASQKPYRHFEAFGNRYFVQNLYEGLDKPGEWYLNRKTGMLYYIPLPGERIETASFVAPVTEQLVSITGVPEEGKFVRNLVFKDICLFYSGAAMAEGGYSEQQSVIFVPAAFSARGVKDLQLLGNHFSHMGTYAIELGAGCTSNNIVGNRINDIGAGGIKIGTQDDPETEEMVTCGNEITDNYVYDLGNVYLTGAGIWIGRSSHNRVAYNEVYNGFNKGISVGWKWRDVLTAAHHNIIEYNHIHDLGQGVIGAASGIYTLSRQPGTIVRYNLIHDLSRYSYDQQKGKVRHSHPCFGLQLDRGSSQITFKYNLIYNVTDNAYKHMNTANVVRNNIFAFTGDYLAVKRGKDKFKGTVTFQQNILLSDNEKMLGDTWLLEDCELDYNLYWDISGQTADFTGMSFNEWQKAGYDEHSLYADPLFVDPKNKDYTLDPASPAFKLGFTPFDLSGVGPRIK